MKNITIAIMSLFVSYAATARADLVCTSTDEELLQPTYELTIDELDKIFTISISGKSRNNYKADYKAAKIVGGLSKIYSLVKIKDDSTWKDMPTQVRLRSSVSIEPNNFYVLFINGATVQFLPRNCRRF